MSSESVSPKKSIGSKAISIVAFPVGTAAFGGVKSIVRNHGIKGAIASLNTEGFKTLNNRLKNLEGVKTDCFSRGMVLASNYEQYASLAKKAAKLQNLVDKNKIPLIDKILNPFRKIFFKDRVVTTDTIKTRLSEATGTLDKAKQALANGEQIVAGTGEALKTGFCKTVGGAIQKGFKDPFVWFFTALETLPEVFQTVIPTFKEKGFVAGIKEAGKTTLKAFGNMATYVTSSAIGRVIGSAIGTFFCPGGGSAVGGNIGSLVAVSLGNILKGKIFKPKQTQVVQQQPQTLNNTSAQKNIYA